MTAPMVRPDTMCSCMMSVKMIGGRTWITVAAETNSQYVLDSVEKPEITTGKVFASLDVRKSASSS